jgi:hypothetical protein
LPSGIKSIAPIRRHPVRGRLNTLANISLGTVAIISRQRLSHQAAGSTSQVTSWPLVPPNWDEIIDQDKDDEKLAEHGGPSGRMSHPGDGNDNDDSKGEGDMQDGEQGSGKGKGTKDRKGKRKVKAMEEGKGKGNGKRKGIVKQPPVADHISRAVGFQLWKEMNEADSDTEG